MLDRSRRRVTHLPSGRGDEHVGFILGHPLWLVKSILLGLRPNGRFVRADDNRPLERATAAAAAAAAAGRERAPAALGGGGIET